MCSQTPPCFLLSRDTYVCYTTNTLDAIEAFIAETYVQLVATKSMCYSTSQSALLERLLANAPTLYCVVPYVVTCVDISRMVLSGPFSPPFAGKSFDTCSKATKQVLTDIQVVYLADLPYFQWGSLGPLIMVGKTKFYFAWHVMRLSYLILYLT